MFRISLNITLVFIHLEAQKIYIVIDIQTMHRISKSVHFQNLDKLFVYMRTRLPLQDSKGKVLIRQNAKSFMYIFSPNMPSWWGQECVLEEITSPAS